MQPSTILPKMPRTLRIATILPAVFVCIGAPLHANPIAGVTSAATFLVKGIVGIPFRILGTATKAVKKGADTTSTRQSTKN